MILVVLVLRRGKKLQMIPPMTLPGQRANRYGTNIGGYGILAIPTLPLISNNSLNKLIAWVWQECHTLLRKSHASRWKAWLFFGLCGVRRPPSDRIPSAVQSDSVRRPIGFRPPRVTFLIIKHPDYMRSGTSMPSSAMPFFSVLPTF